MKPPLLPFAIACTAFAGSGLAQPVISAVENNYSYVFQGLPNYGIAQGSIFVIFGSNLATTSSGLQGAPLKATLDGVSVQVTVNGIATQALLYYVTAGQVAGILSSNTPVGTGVVTVSLSGQTSAPAPITVVQSAFGIVTADESGLGPAAAFDVDWNPLTAANSANPGDVITLWGSGLGPISGDESVSQPQSLANIPVEVDIGGVPAAVQFHGRSQFPGLDQINVVIPGGSTGCYVSVVVRSGNLVSNSPTIPVAANGRTCADHGLGPVQILSGGSAYKVGGLQLLKMTNYGPISAGGPYALQVRDLGNGEFDQWPLTIGPTYQLGYSAASPSPGSCVTHPFPWPVATGGGVITPGKLDAGPAINFTGPDGKGTAPLQASPVSDYSATLAAPGSPPFIPTGGGMFTVDNGGGGAGVGSFVLQFNIPAPLIWSNIASSASIDRTQGLTISWTGGDPQGIVLIDGTSYGSDTSFGVQLFCAALVSAHQFTVPPSALLAMPPYAVTATDGYFATLSINAESFFLFSAAGLDGGLFTAASNSGAVVSYR